MAYLHLVSVVLGLLFAVTFYQGLIRFLSRKSRGKLPPGPTPLPIIGNLHLLGDLPHKSMAKLSKKYGPIMILKLGHVTTVVISSSGMAKEVLQKNDLAFSDRSIPYAMHAFNHLQFSVIWLPAVASRWRTLRKILNTTIFSVSRLDSREQLRSRKVEEVISYCRKNCQSGCGKAVNIGGAAFGTSVNLLANTLFSKDLTDPNSESAQEFRDSVWNILVDTGKPNLVDLFPILQKVDPQGVRRRTEVHFEKILENFRGLISERLEQKSKGSDSEGGGLVSSGGDVLDVLLATAEESPEEIDGNQIEHLFLDLFVAGTDSTSSTVEWAMAEMLKNPDKMKKAQAELEQVIGKGKAIGEADMGRLPYLRCVVKETLRIHPPVPFLFRQKLMDQDVEVCGYRVPKGSRVLVNVWAIGRDEEIWENPLAFVPERFLDSEIDVRGRDFELIPFGAGRRICPGLSLAVRVVHAMLGSLLNSFNWRLDGDIVPEELDMGEKFGITVHKAHPLFALPIPP